MKRQSKMKKYSDKELLLFKELQMPKCSIEAGVEIADSVWRILRRLIDLERKVKAIERKRVKTVKLIKPMGGER